MTSDCPPGGQTQLPPHLRKSSDLKLFPTACECGFFSYFSATWACQTITCWSSQHFHIAPDF